MAEAISDPLYWKERLEDAGYLHQAIYQCTLDEWNAIEAHHRKVLETLIESDWNILDAGCAWGRLIDLLPKAWRGEYTGIDLCPEFIQMAKLRPNLDRSEKFSPRFICAPLQEALPKFPDKSIDCAVFGSIRPMVIRNLGKEYWECIESETRRVSKRIVYLEYDTEEFPQLEVCL